MAQTTSSSPQTGPSGLLGSGTPHDILVVEDDPISRRLLTRNLEKAGYTVRSAEDGRQALDLIAERAPSLVVTNWVMPNLDGSGLCSRIKDNPALAHIYIIVLTAQDASDTTVFALDAGADDLILKPWNPSTLLARIRVGLRNVELQNALTERSAQLRRINNRHSRDLEIISQMQKSMLPLEIPRASAYDFTAFYLPSAESVECGGDYYDVIQLDGDHQGFVIADVSGHGAPAMVTMALVRQNFHIFAPQFSQPHLLLQEMNRLLHDHLPTDQFATMHYAIINTQTLEYRYASAGHNPPLLYRARTGEVSCLKNCEGFPLKLVTRNAFYNTNTIHLEAGDRLVLYTDGVPECFNHEHEIYDMERFEGVLAAHATEPPGQIESAIVTDVLQFADGRETDDDLTLAILGVNATHR